MHCPKSYLFHSRSGQLKTVQSYKTKEKLVRTSTITSRDQKWATISCQMEIGWTDVWKDERLTVPIDGNKMRIEEIKWANKSVMRLGEDGLKLRKHNFLHHNVVLTIKISFAASYKIMKRKNIMWSNRSTTRSIKKIPFSINGSKKVDARRNVIEAWTRSSIYASWYSVKFGSIPKSTWK